MVDVIRLEFHMKRIEDKVESGIKESQKLSRDFSRIIKAIEHMAGDKWPDIAKKIKDGELTHD